MREVEFRVWHKSLRKWCPEYIVAQPGKDINKVFQDQNVVFSQFTGLFDEDGKKIYEGDICSVSFETTHTVGKVEIVSGHTAINMCPIWPEYKILVIGNVFENSGLLRHTK